MFFSSASARIRSAISADCTGEPPGLLISRATAGACLWAKAASSARSRPASVSPRPARPTLPITPARRMAGIVGAARRHGRRNAAGKFIDGSPVLVWRSEERPRRAGRLRRRGVAAVRLVQYEAAREPRPAPPSLARRDDHPLGRGGASALGQSGKTTTSPARPEAPPGARPARRHGGSGSAGRAAADGRGRRSIQARDVASRPDVRRAPVAVAGRRRRLARWNGGLVITWSNGLASGRREQIAGDDLDAGPSVLAAAFCRPSASSSGVALQADDTCSPGTRGRGTRPRRRCRRRHRAPARRVGPAPQQPAGPGRSRPGSRVAAGCSRSRPPSSASSVQVRLSRAGHRRWRRPPRPGPGEPRCEVVGRDQQPTRETRRCCPRCC